MSALSSLRIILPSPSTIGTHVHSIYVYMMHVTIRHDILVLHLAPRIPPSHATCYFYKLPASHGNFFVIAGRIVENGICFLTDLFTYFELLNPSFDVPELNAVPWSPELEALKLWKGRSGLKLHSAWSSRFYNEILAPENIQLITLQSEKYT